MRPRSCRTPQTDSGQALPGLFVELRQDERVRYAPVNWAVVSEGAEDSVSAGSFRLALEPGRWSLRLMGEPHGVGASPEVLQVLLDAGADSSPKDRDGRTAWDLIQENEALKGTPAYWALSPLRIQ